MTNIQSFKKDLIKSNAISQMVSEYKAGLKMEFFTFEEFRSFLGDKTCNASIKIDGELIGFTYKNGNVITYTRGGMIRYDMPVTYEIEEVLSRAGIDEFIGIGEIYVIDDKGKPLSYLRSQSTLRDPDEMSVGTIKILVIDVYSINNEVLINNPQEQRVERIQAIFNNANYVSPAYYALNVTIEDVSKLWDYVMKPEQYGFEGLVCYVGKKVIKIKPVLSFDMVIVALNRSKSDPNIISAVTASFIDENGVFRFHGKIGSGFTDHDRVLLLEWAERNKVFEDEEGLIWINPFKEPLIVEVQGEEVNVKPAAAYKFDNNQWTRVEDQYTGVIRYPVLVRFRTDKAVTHADLRLEQIPGFSQMEKKSSLTIKASEPENPDTVIVKPNEYYKNGLTEKDVYNYYRSMAQFIINTYKSNNLDKMSMIVTDDGPVYKRNDLDFDTTDQFDSSFNNGRTISWHFSLRDEVPFIFADLDPNNEFPFEDAKQVAKELSEYFLESDYIKDTSIHFSGSRGFYVYGILKEPMNIDEAKELLKSIVEGYIEDKGDERLTTGVIK